MEIHFILVEPAVPENIGAAARAIKTMGFKFLRLVNPCNYLDDKAQMLAHGSVDILKKALVFHSLKEALQDIDFVVGTTAKRRLAKNDYYNCPEIYNIIKRKSGTASNVALVFGRESKGLLNNEIKQCDILSSIPMKRKYPSINLAQSVMIYAYTLSPLVLEEPDKKSKNVGRSQMRVLKENVSRIMREIGIKPNIFGRIMERLSVLGDGDIHLLHSLCNKLIQRIEKS
jgi:tRNA/rRNA methyltransferase